MTQRRPIAAGAFLMLVASGVLVAGVFLGSQYLQHLRGLSALETGLADLLPDRLQHVVHAILAGAGRTSGRPGPTADHRVRRPIRSG